MNVEAIVEPNTLKPIKVIVQTKVTVKSKEEIQSKEEKHVYEFDWE